MTWAVRVPATSANLGPGFDALAVAVAVYLDVTMTAREERRVVTEGEGAGELPTDESNLVWRALSAACGRARASLPDVSLHVRSDIPVERGLGSSAAAAVAGASLGRALTGGGSDDDVVDLAAELEGHRDNAAAAVHGGLVVCHGSSTQRLDPSPALRPVLCVPAERQSTAAARRVLPDAVPLADAAANGARAALVLAGLAGAVPWDPSAMTDILHEPARFEGMPASGRLVHALRGRGIGAALSGAGPAVLAIVPSGDAAAVEAVRAAAEGWSVEPAVWDLTGASLTGAQPALG